MVPLQRVPITAACNLLCVSFSGSMFAFWGVDAELLDTQQCILMDMVAAVLTATESANFARHRVHGGRQHWP